MQNSIYTVDKFWIFVSYICPVRQDPWTNCGSEIMDKIKIIETCLGDVAVEQDIYFRSSVNFFSNMQENGVSLSEYITATCPSRLRLPGWSEPSPPCQSCCISEWLMRMPNDVSRCERPPPFVSPSLLQLTQAFHGVVMMVETVPYHVMCMSSFREYPANNVAKELWIFVLL